MSSVFKFNGTITGSALNATTANLSTITNLECDDFKSNLSLTSDGPVVCNSTLSNTNLSSLTYIDSVSMLTGTNASISTVYTSNIESQTGTLNIATEDSSVSTVNIATSNSVQTVNIGTVGTGQTQVNIGGPGDTVNIAGNLVYVNSTVTEITNPVFVINEGNPNINNSGIIVSKTGIGGASTGAYILVNSTSDAWVLKAGSGPTVTMDQNVSTGSSPSFTNVYSSGQLLGNSVDSVSAPSYSWAGDTNSGMYHPATDTIGFVTSGSEQMRITSAGLIGVGTTTPASAKMEIWSASSQTGGIRLSSNLGYTGVYTYDPQWYELRGGKQGTSGGYLRLSAGGSNQSDPNSNARIDILGYNSNYISFNPQGNTERMRLTTTGLAISRTGAGYPLDVAGVIRIGDLNSAGYLINLGNTGTFANYRSGYIYGDGTNMDFANQQAGSINLITNNTKYGMLDAKGNFILGYGAVSPTIGSLTGTMMISKYAGSITGALTTVANGYYLGLGQSEYNVSAKTYRLIGMGYRNVTVDQYWPAYMGYLSNTDDGRSNGNIVFGTRSVTTDTEPTERMRITYNGLIGIGTTGPVAKLDIVSGSTLASSTETSNNAFMIGTGKNTYDQVMYMGCYTGSSSGVGSYSYIQSVNYGNISNALLLNARGGNVGIGTTEPSKTLDVSSNSSFGTTAQFFMPGLTGGNTNEIRVGRDISNYANLSYAYGDDQWWLGTASSNKSLYGDGNGIVYTSGDLYVGQNATINGTLSKGGGSFEINHPIQTGTRLVHSFIEGPRCDLIYRGLVQLQNGFANVNIDTDCTFNPESAMTTGTFVALCANPQVFLQNEDGFDRVKGKVSGNLLSIVCENSQNSSDYISWMVVAERKDPFIKTWNRTDNNGFLITEHKK